MRAVVQRVESASVAAGGQELSAIGRGLLVYLGVGDDDESADAAWMTDKVAHLRIFEDEKGAMNRSLLETKGEVLVVSQFTLHGDCRRGRRPSFGRAMEPGRAEALYEKVVEELARLGVPPRKGRFGALMKVRSVNDGPVTLLLDSKKGF